MRFDGFVLFFGYAASALVFAAFFMRSRMRLRQVAIASNVGFIAYGIAGDIIPVLVLHALLLPLNVWRLCELERSRKDLRTVKHSDFRVEWFAPFARVVVLGPGEALFARGDAGDDVYFVVSGSIRLVESGLELGPGALLGEVLMFAPRAWRTESAVATAEANLVAMSPEELLALYRQSPDFGLCLLRLLSNRVLEGNRRLFERAGASWAQAS